MTICSLEGFLRCSSTDVLILGMLFRPFGTGDQRLRVALKEHEPLIHFALVCGAKSCPPIKTYSAEGIMDQVRIVNMFMPCYVTECVCVHTSCVLPCRQQSKYTVLLIVFVLFCTISASLNAS